MAAEFKGKRAATAEAQRILCRQIDKGLSCLAARRPSDGSIHRARKQIKMARATLRLLRSGLSVKQFRTENRRLRDAARPLSAARDAAVLRKIFQHLQPRRGGVHRLEEALEIERMLADEQVRVHRQVYGGQGIAHSRRLLRKARGQASRWDLNKGGWSTIGPGLRRVYRGGRKALQAICHAPSDAGFHEWRKQVKYLRDQIQLLRPVWPGSLDSLARQLHALADCLGDDHDLVVLRSKLTAKSSARSGKSTRQPMLKRLVRESSELRRKALERGIRIYEEPPPRFCARLRTYWHEWQGA
jgi:CHAD domain-containing protein